MQFDFESLTAEPMIYMLMHSGTFVAVLGGICCVVGLLFGYATWGRYKSQARELRGQVMAMKGEIADLKRKVADHSVKSGPAIAIATETIHMPKQDGVMVAATAAAIVAPATEEAPRATVEARPRNLQTEQVPTRSRLPKSRANVIKPKTAAVPAVPAELALNDGVSEPAAPASGAAPEVPPAEPVTASTLLSPVASPPPPARHTSPLAAIIAPGTPFKKESAGTVTVPSDGLLPADTIPMLPELPAVAPSPGAILPELDSHLGLIYKTRPGKCDDLTALKGIAQVLEQRLHEFGIYTYAQIAGWNEDNIKEFSTRLAFKDRIQRERWVEQAQQLLARQSENASYDVELGSWGR